LPYGFAVALGSHAIQAIDQQLDGYFIKQQARKMKQSSSLGWLSSLKFKQRRPESQEISITSPRPFSMTRAARTASVSYGSLDTIRTARDSIRVLKSGSIDSGAGSSSMMRANSIYFDATKGPRGSSTDRDDRGSGSNRGILRILGFNKQESPTRDRRMSFSQETELPIEDLAAERVDSESVIFTAVIKTAKKDVDELIIITTHRIASVYYRRDKGGSKLTKRWIIRFTELAGVEYSLGSTNNNANNQHRAINLGSGATLTLRVEGSDRSKDKQIVVDNYLEDTLVAVHKCICVLTGKLNDINRDDCEGMKYDPFTKIFYIGPWEYDDTKAKRDEKYYASLPDPNGTESVMADLENQLWDPVGCTHGQTGREGEANQVNIFS
jgi:hypothetical protein